MVRISVLASDIEIGRAADCQRCPIAVAANRAFAPDRVEVDQEALTVFHADGKYHKHAYLPREATAFIYAFDAGADVKPFTFEVNCEVSKGCPRI